MRLDREMDGAQVRALRERLRLDQRGLARLIGVSERTLRNWETGAAIPPIARVTITLLVGILDGAAAIETALKALRDRHG